MIIDPGTCVGCQACQIYCPMSAIVYVPDSEICQVNLDECVECGICLRPDPCPTGALQQQELDEMRELRRAFSNPLVPHKSTSVPGRGTEEIKTNEDTGRFKRGHAGIAVELGRPGTGTRFKDVETVAMAIAKCGVSFEPHNPVTVLMTDVKNGKMRDDILNEKVLSAIVELIVAADKVADVLKAVKSVAGQLDTVFSLDLACRVNPDNSAPVGEIARSVGFTPSINGKTNVGLGRPLAKED